MVNAQETGPSFLTLLPLGLVLLLIAAAAFFVIYKVTHRK
ncbi:hypothetical protein HNQ79_004027 [Streptomyces candidus]|uniref:Uncharacterized protein n=1 Tax=Streptomyces candidus TaxID=67283 RepID=A0A7X0HH34_9ACTN|nr:hypothetical protein [Streptomyces candidus]